MRELPVKPLLSEKDEESSGEVSLDPLGLYPISNALATRLAPGVRERQRHPRFLTAIAVSLTVCVPFDDETFAKDGVSSPWQVFEWYFVEGLVRKMEGSVEIRGLPGSDKAAMAINDEVPLSAKRYLVMPSVFGFHGVYRTLAREIDIEETSCFKLGGTGERLMVEWEKEQDLPGFVYGTSGKGYDLKVQLYDAVKKGLESASTNRSWNWNGWDFFSDHLAPYKFGPNETRIIIEALKNGSDFRKQLINFMATNGKEHWQPHESEKLFHQAFMKHASDELKELLRAIAAYEEFARFLQDAFDNCLYIMTNTSGRTSIKELARELKKLIPDQAADIFIKVSDLLGPYGLTQKFVEGFSAFGEKKKPEEWTAYLLDHHRKVQKNKPPNGKNPWFDTYDDGSVVVRPGYRIMEKPQNDGNYVHFYRTQPIWSFVNDLRLIK